MRPIFRGKPAGLCAFLAIAALVAGGLGWVTAAVLRLEREQFEARTDKEFTQKLHVALWRLDGRLAPVLAREGSRPYNHYSAVHAPSVVLGPDLQAWPHGAVLAPSPLLHAELPDWMSLHFQADDDSGWESPQVLGGAQRRRLADPRSRVDLRNATDERRLLLDDLQRTFPPTAVLEAARARGAALDVRETTLLPPGRAWDLNGAPTPQAAPNAPPATATKETYSRFQQQRQIRKEVNPAQLKEPADVALNNTSMNGANWLAQGSNDGGANAEVEVHLSPLGPLWLTTDRGEPRLLWARLVKIEDKELCQGVVLDWARLRNVLVDEIEDLFPGATFEPVLPGQAVDPERTMSTLDVRLVPGPPADAPAPPAWGPLRLGLVLAWTAALVALGAVGLGGWSLLDLSERRIRFVSAVTHELRTPLTTLRLYLDMLTGGMVKEEAKKEEYLHTLNAEADRLNRLVGNVLDFSRLENQRPRLRTTPVALGDLLDGVRADWQGRCHDAGKDLVVETSAAPATLLETDVTLARQVLGNLIDNACKYSRGAEDRRVWLRAAAEGSRLLLEVEDRGPGVAARERRSIFLPFRRGVGTDTVGGVGLGLALAERWARVLGGRLTLRGETEGSGACFRLELPAAPRAC